MISSVKQCSDRKLRITGETFRLPQDAAYLEETADMLELPAWWRETWAGRDMVFLAWSERLT